MWKNFLPHHIVFKTRTVCPFVHGLLRLKHLLGANISTSHNWSSYNCIFIDRFLMFSHAYNCFWSISTVTISMRAEVVWGQSVELAYILPFSPIFNWSSLRAVGQHNQILPVGTSYLCLWRAMFSVHLWYQLHLPLQLFIHFSTFITNCTDSSLRTSIVATF